MTRAEQVTGVLGRGQGEMASLDALTYFIP
jgi:hypothetical protein